MNGKEDETLDKRDQVFTYNVKTSVAQDATAFSVTDTLVDVLEFAGTSSAKLNGQALDASQIKVEGQTPELVEGVHIEGQVVDFPMIISDWGIDILVEFRKLVDVIPNRLVVSMENVGAKFVDLNARDFFRIDIARQVVALLNNQDALAFQIGRAHV